MLQRSLKYSEAKEKVNIGVSMDRDAFCYDKAVNV